MCRPEYPTWGEVFAKCPSCGAKINSTMDVDSKVEDETVRETSGLAPSPHSRPTSSGGIAPPLTHKTIYYRCPNFECQMLFTPKELKFNVPTEGTSKANMKRKPSW
jgi:hypothetical protein